MTTTKQSLSMLLLCLFFNAGIAIADQGGGPPEHVRKAVDGLVDVMRGSDETSIETFLDRIVSPDAKQSRDELRDIVDGLRGEARNKLDELSVERAPVGLNVVFRGPAGSLGVNIVVEQTGIVEISRVEEPQYSRDESLDEAIAATTQALEMSFLKPLDEVVADFEANHLSEDFIKTRTSAERRALLSRIREAAEHARGALLDPRPGGYALIMEGVRTHEVRFSLSASSPFMIETLSIEELKSIVPADLEPETLERQFDEMVGQTGISGVVHVTHAGKVLMRKPFGMANASLNIPNRLDTIFGIGSSPIDFTVAGIYLLEQEGRLDLDDPVSKFFANVPADKKSLTLRHLITGRSGLPDFHHTDDDWDDDLGWIDRSEAVRRILSQPLLFDPGKGNKHSHSAYGLVAAVIEMVSGHSYYEFLKERFFEPAGMSRTSMTGDTLGLGLADFAAGGGPNYVGLPNIPPNWGPTSWLVLGSGGMCSTLDDMLKFYSLASSTKVLEQKYADHFAGATFSVNGSDRGFYLFYARKDDRNYALLMLNFDGRDPGVRTISNALGELIEPR